MEFRTLEDVSPEALVEAFNESFSEYFVPLNMTQDRLQEKMATEGIGLNYSVGTFEAGKLCGFILNAVDEYSGSRTAYNGGTGVLPAFRGKNLTKKMYDFILPTLKDARVEKFLLEVISENSAAIKSYKSVGFTITRELDCFKGAVLPKRSVQVLEVTELKDIDWPHLQSFWEWQPTWQNGINSVKRAGKNVKIIGIKKSSQTIAYAVYNVAAGRVLQFAVSKDHRRRGFGSLLFSHIAKDFGHPISLINIDHSATGTLQFLNSIGLNLFLRQYEMEMIL